MYLTVYSMEKHMEFMNREMKKRQRDYHQLIAVRKPKSKHEAKGEAKIVK